MTTHTLHQAAQMALDALDNLGSMSDHDVTPYAWHGAKAEQACTALREALAAPMPEPDNDDVLWLWKDGDHFLAFRHLYPCYSPGGDPMTVRPTGQGDRFFSAEAISTTGGGNG